MSEENVENARRGYAVLNEAYRAGDPSIFRPILEEYWDRNVVFEPAGVLPDSSPRPHKGWDGVLAFIGESDGGVQRGLAGGHGVHRLRVTTWSFLYRFGGLR